MNYRHIYHAGNFADVIKHIVLRIILTHLQQKEGAIATLDAFAGLGRYDLAAEAPQKTGEYKSGIERVMAAKFINADVVGYQKAVKPFWARQRYPGSPLILAHMLRPQDRMVVNELHNDDARTLRNFMNPYPSITVTQEDAYQAIRAFLPPKNARAFVVIDPPFERKDEYEVLSKQAPLWLKKCATATITIWYPIKAHSDVDEMIDAITDIAADHHLSRVHVCEFLQFPRDQEDTFNGCGLLTLNAPFTLYDRVENLRDELCAALGYGTITQRWLINN
jgi:23S rRNA (adenine2030-N6)-methyltransferase